LRKLDITKNIGGDPVAVCLSDALITNRSLTSLKYDSNDITMEGWKTFKDCLQHNHFLHELPVPQADITKCISLSKDKPTTQKIIASIMLGIQERLKANQPKMFSVKAVGIIENPNWMYRELMEDTHLAIDKFGGLEHQGYWGVYDGHGGVDVAVFVRKILHQNVMQCLVNATDIKKSMKDAYLKTNKQVLEYCASISGSTAVSVLLRKNQNGERCVYTANVGDSRAVLCRGGEALRLSVDHVPDDKEEYERLTKQNIKVDNGRIDGLSVSRSFGDKDFIQHGVIAEPYVSCTVLKPEDTHIVVACDGLWDVMTDQQAIDLIKNETSDAQKASEKLSYYAIEKGTQDNVTIMVIIL